MRYGDIQIDPQGRYRSDNVLSFTAVTVTVGGQTIEARIVIHPTALHHQMVRATKNRSKQSSDGAVTVKILAH